MNRKRETCAGIGRTDAPCYRNTLASSFYYWLENSSVLRFIRSGLSNGEGDEEGQGLRIHFITIHTIFLFLLFLSSRYDSGPITKIHEIRPFNTGIPGIVVFG